MNLERVEQIAKAVLYEGYMLYPYRRSSVKNQQRWNFGVLYPQDYSEAQGGQEACSMQTECLIEGSAGATIEVRLRFLHLQTRSTRTCREIQAGSLPDGWQEAVERDVCLPETKLGIICLEKLKHSFVFASETQVQPESNADGGVGRTVERRQEAVEGTVEISAEQLRDDLYKIRIQVQNVTPSKVRDADRNGALMQSMVSTHTIVGVKDGQFISLLEPPAERQELVSGCQNVGAWPVLVGEAGQRDTLLASSIILYDNPQIAPESAGDLFDGTEIDEILSLRILTLTDDEKQEMRQSDDRARQILERTESMPVEQFMKLHGVVRSLRPLKEGTP